MSDELLEDLATRAGVSIFWRDQSGADRRVSAESLRAILAALELPASNDGDLRHSLRLIEDEGGKRDGFAVRVGESIPLPLAGAATPVEATLEDGTRRLIRPVETASGLALPGFDAPGYHRLHLPGGDRVLAVAPERCTTFADLSGGASGWGLAAQVYSLRGDHDCGIGDFGGVAALARSAAGLGADFLAISPVHALFGATPDHYSPYSPSTRLFYNPLCASAALVFPESLIRRAVETAGLGERMNRLADAPQIDWPAGHAAKRALFRALYDLLPKAGKKTLADFRAFRDGASDLLKDFALFEVLHGAQSGADPALWSWRRWPEGLGPREAKKSAAARSEEMEFQIFLQWLVARSYGAAQRACRDNGMRAGLIADLAIGIDPSGAHAWARPDEVLQGLTIGAPPDYYSAEGQNWGLTGFSPRGLAAKTFEPFIDTLRANLRHSGGLRIDHVMGLSRLWLIPEGGGALDGAYVDYPAKTLYRLAALESWRHGALVIGEDLGTLPMGYQDQLAAQGVAGMRVLRFERDANGFRAPEAWSPQAAALTSTHDMISTAGWWKGADLEGEAERQELEDIRAWDRGLLWWAFQQAGVASGERPAPEDAEPVVEAALSFIAKTSCVLKLVSLEDALASDVQPNVPGTTVEKPNWRHRFVTPAGDLLDESARARLTRLGPPRASP
ncbi:4-alpha-glucanotransferase [Rhodoblastus acidophilus]|uniref:4-alpha-glucanotransferase n=1 Tax=Rhodoblastus acidophilus TaxID=1074 RepID=A0A6N8DTF7_RHOAC|nr:4-alpha-glucanotransferase [Rhodoblastus acidophilus]MCW2275881.1 4-alpha-glucanotransferase [Rhodoblastus acidophilus]MTV32473.1 4-alpha-glucanotransferase [Rhodoblastus acidophilus]